MVSLTYIALFLASLTMLATSLAQNSPQDFLDPQNAARAKVGVGELSWDDTVAAYAENYANVRKGDCELVHSGGPYGENIFKGGGSSWAAADAVALWVGEKQYYDCPSNSCADGKVCGHYTQVVWANSVRVGCAAVTCDDGDTFITCNYDPPGNFGGEGPYPGCGVATAAI